MAQDKLDELKNILLGDELRRFDTKFMEFGDKLKNLSDVSKATDLDSIKKSCDEQIAALEEKMNEKLKLVAQKTIEKVNTVIAESLDAKVKELVGSQVNRLEGEIAKFEKEVETMRKKFDAFKQLFSER